MLVLPIRTDRRLKHKPVVNIALIAVNVGAFLYTGGAVIPGDAEWGLMLQPVQPQWYQFFTYQFLHQGWEHIVANMFFLWVFGNSMEDRLGPVGYLGFYLGGGVIAGFGHSLISSAPVLGASGAIAAVTGAYLALFPRSQVTLFFWFFLFIDFFQISSLWLVLFQFGSNLFLQLFGRGQDNVAYLAHLSGYGYGFVVAMGLLWTRLLPREPFDFPSLLDRWNRRRQMRAATRAGGSPWAGQPSRVGEAPPPPTSEEDRRVLELRREITGALKNHEPDRALASYEKLLAIDPKRPMARQAQLDLANLAMNQRHHETAAHAYELFLAAYGAAGHREVELILGLIYARYLSRPDRARELLTAAAEHLADDAQRQLAREALGQLEE